MSVTIVTCVHNGERFWNRYLASLLILLEEVEAVIIVDDGSTDQTRSLLSQFKHPKVSVLFKQNSGLPSSRNYGLERVKSESVLFLDVDDTLELDGLSAAREKMTSRVDAVIGGVRYVDEHGGQSIYLKISSFLKAISYKMLFNPNRKIFFNNYAVTPGAVLLRTKMAKDLMFNESLSIGEDWDFFSRYFSSGSIEILDKKLVNYMVSQGSMSHTALNDVDKTDQLKEALVKNYMQAFSGGSKYYEKHLDVVLALFSEKRRGYPMSFCNAISFHMTLLKKSPISWLYIGTSLFKFALRKVT